jgi:hypothetical protein
LDAAMPCRHDIFKRSHIPEVDMAIKRSNGRKNNASPASLFLGFEHSGLYPVKTNAEAIAAWYENAFEFKRTDEKISYFLSGPGKGRLEVLKSAAGNAHLHIAIQVSDFEKAVAALKAKGIRLKEPIIEPNLKIVYLEETDPEGNPVHLWWARG